MKILLLWLAASLPLLFSPAASYDYCRLTARHTLCGYRGPAPACRALSRRGLAARERVAILDAHNKLRALVARGETRQPSGADMRQLSWDQELARLAQAHADTCQAAAAHHRDQTNVYWGNLSHKHKIHKYRKSVCPLWLRAGFSSSGTTVAAAGRCRAGGWVRTCTSPTLARLTPARTGRPRSPPGSTQKYPSFPPPA